MTFLNFQLALWVPVIVGGVMIVHDARKGRVRLPWVLATGSWVAIILGFYFLPGCAWFVSLADWYRSFA